MQALGDRGKKEHVRDDVRASIAHGAAKLVSEGMTDYHAAKLKAARQLGVTDSKSLPDNREIETALRERMALFQTDTQPAALLALRETALRTMRWLERFSPWLCGAVLNGTANEFNAIELELVGVEAKVFELFLLNEGINFQTREPARRKNASFAMQYEIEYDDIPIHIALFDGHAQRQAAYPQDNLRHARVQRDEALALFEANLKR